MSTSIFNKPTPTLTKDKKETTRLKPKDIDQEDLFDIIEEYEKIEKESKKLSSKSDILKENLRKIAVTEYLDKYVEDNKNPGSIIIEALNEDGDIGQYMFVPQDRFIGIKSEKQAKEIEKKYGKGIVDRNIIYSFDPDMLEKYSKVISKLFEDSEDIKEEDKSKLFIATESYKIISGTINELNSLESDNIREVFENLKPVVSIKNAEVIIKS